MARDTARATVGHRSEEHIVRTATEARQGEIILGRRGRWVWIGAFVAMLALAIFLLAH
jgi:hypothetical protein